MWNPSDSGRSAKQVERERPKDLCPALGLNRRPGVK